VPPIGWYAVVLASAAAATAVLTPVARWYSLKVGYVALPDPRKVHKTATASGGGAALFLGFLIAMIVAAVVPALHNVFASSSEPLGVVLAGAAIFAVGLIDDLRDMSAPAKVAGEVLAASILYFMGVTMYQFKIPLAGFIVLSPSVIPLITALWVIALTNAVNLIDGLDGLAAGIVAIGSGALAIYGLRLMQLGVLPSSNIGPLVAVIACGICLGFLPFNFHPAKIFMGDAGALFLGLLMSAATMVIGGRLPPATSGTTYFFYAPLFLPLFILGVPLIDMAFAVARRTATKTKFHTPDRNHIHHRLLRLGHGHRRSVAILWAWTALLSALLLFPLFGAQTTTADHPPSSRLNAFIPFVVVALAIGLYTFFHPGLRRQGEDELEEPEPEPTDHGQPSGPVGANGIDRTDAGDRPGGALTGAGPSAPNP
jgi:UDP-GlcNAc:undecaprenyl-phosphate/decaprenyl-phosphate GlcNAc-1-phosphate transferase